MRAREPGHNNGVGLLPNNVGHPCSNIFIVLIR